MEKNILTDDAAIQLIKSGQPISDKEISGKLDLKLLEVNYDIKEKVVIENCIINEIFSYGSAFKEKVIIRDCTFKDNAMFQAVYFNGGLEIDNCIFEGLVDFSSSGHNFTNNEIKIENNIFKKFVDFDDCMYEGPFILNNNNFSEGTNLLGEWELSPVFGETPLIEDNLGNLKLVALPESYYYQHSQEKSDQPNISEISMEKGNADDIIKSFLTFIDTLIPEDRISFIQDQLDKLKNLHQESNDTDVKRFIDVLEAMRDVNKD